MIALNLSWLNPRDSCFTDFVTSISTGVTSDYSNPSLYSYYTICNILNPSFRMLIAALMSLSW